MPVKRLAIFDFCGTLISFQTADRYVNFCVERLKENRAVQRRRRIVRWMDKLRVFKLYNRINPDNNWHKRVMLWQLRGVAYGVCDKLAEVYFYEQLLPNTVQPVIEKLEEHIQKGDRVCILSGGYDIYIKYFAQHFNVRETITSKIAFLDGRCTGKMEGADCMRENKADYLRPVLDGTPTVCYTDSKSDIPLLEMVDEPVVVSHQISQQWAETRNYKQIIWN